MFGSIYSIGGQIELLNSSIKNIENTLANGEPFNVLIKNAQIRKYKTFLKLTTAKNRFVFNMYLTTCY